MKTTNSKFKNFTFVKTQEILDFFENAINDGSLINMSYSSKNSTDNEMFDIFPFALIDLRGTTGFQLLAVKAISDGYLNFKYEMRRYNLSSMSDISLVVDKPCKLLKWSELIDYSEEIFPNLSTSKKNEIIFMYDWKNWKNWNIKKEFLKDTSKNIGSNNKSVTVGFIANLNSNPGNDFIYIKSDSPNKLIYMINNETINQIDPSLIPIDCMTMREMPACHNKEDFKVGDVVKVNLLAGSGSSKWSKIRFTVKDNQVGKDYIECLGIDKNRNFYTVYMPANSLIIMKPSYKLKPSYSSSDNGSWD